MPTFIRATSPAGLDNFRRAPGNSQHILISNRKRCEVLGLPGICLVRSRAGLCRWLRYHGGQHLLRQDIVVHNAGMDDLRSVLLRDVADVSRPESAIRPPPQSKRS